MKIPISDFGRREIEIPHTVSLSSFYFGTLFVVYNSKQTQTHMNRRNNWQDLLTITNEDLSKKKVCIVITDPEGEGFYRCDILKDGVEVETYAENYYENELTNLIDDAFHYANNL